jgi:hypothetical protein
MLLAILPHLIENYVLFNNPIAPFNLSGMGWADQTWFGPETTRRIVLTYPLALTFGKYWAQYGNLSPLVLAFLPLSILLPRHRSLLASSLAAITLAASAGLICWVILRPSLLSPRYILATLLLFIPLAARAAEHISRSNPKQHWFGAGILAAIIVTVGMVNLYFVQITFFPKNTARYLVGRMSECERDGVYCLAMEALNKQAEPGMVFGKTSEERWLGIYKRGFRYLLADRIAHSKMIEDLNIDQPPPWLQIVPIFEVAHLSVYQLDFDDPPGEPLVECLQVSPPAWDVVAR